MIVTRPPARPYQGGHRPRWVREPHVPPPICGQEWWWAGYEVIYARYDQATIDHLPVAWREPQVLVCRRRPGHDGACLPCRVEHSSEAPTGTPTFTKPTQHERWHDWPGVR